MRGEGNIEQLMKTLICGGIAIDDITLPNVKLEGVVGGSAIYASFAASIFTKTILSGIIGYDFPKFFLESLKKRNIDISLVKLSKKPSFRWKAVYSEDLRQIDVTEQKINAFEDFELTNSSLIKNCKTVFISNMDPAIQLKLVKKLPKRMIKIVDSMNLWIIEKRELLKEVLKFIDIIMIDENEARLLVQDKCPIWELVDKIMLMGPKVIILKKGEYGLTMYGRMGILSLPSYPLTNAIDPSGAGDSLGGAIAAVLAKIGTFDKKSVQTAVFLGNIVASFVVGDYTFNSLKKITLTEVINRSDIYKKQLLQLDKLMIEKVI